MFHYPILGRRVFDGPQLAPPTYPPGRFCLDPDCTTRLNRYNRGPWCNTHWYYARGGT